MNIADPVQPLQIALNVFRQRKLNEPSQGTAGVGASNEPNKVDKKTDVEDVKSMVSPAEDASVDVSTTDSLLLR